MKKAIDILVDASGSMNQAIDATALGATRYQTVVEYIESEVPKIFQPDLRYGLSYFGTHPRGTVGHLSHECHVERLGKIEPRTLTELMALIQLLPKNPSKNAITPLADAMKASIEELMRCDVEHRAIIVFSDGKDEGSENSLEQVKAYARERLDGINWNRFEINAVHIGTIDPPMRDLAEFSNGRVVELQSSADPEVHELFAEIALRHLPPEIVLRRTVEIALNNLVVPRIQTLAGALDVSNQRKSDGNLRTADQGILDRLTALEVAAKETAVSVAKIASGGPLKRSTIVIGIASLIMAAVAAALCFHALDLIYGIWSVLGEVRRYLIGKGA